MIRDPRFPRHLDRVTVIVEPDFSNKGFGHPDAVLLLENNSEQFVLIAEAKRKQYAQCCGKSRGQENYNSTLKGQLELNHILAVALSEYRCGNAALTEPDWIITSPGEALDVFDFEEAAHRKVRDSHWAYMVSGVDDDATLRANREGYKHVQLRPRRLRDATKVDMRVELFGTVSDGPIFLCPISGHKAFWPNGEEAVARAAKARGTLQFLSSASSTGIEDVNKALGRPVWYQVYAPSTWEACEQPLQRVQSAGCPVIALTVDNTTGRNSETYLRTRPKDLTQCAACHKGEPFTDMHELPMFDGINMNGVTILNPALDWAFADRMRKFWKGKFFIKGIDTREDARLAIEHGFDGILVSNHGGRATETLRPTVEALPEVVEAVGDRVPVFVDGGIRRGTDVFKALALGATAVGIGRPYLWGLGAFGQAGVDRVLEILQGELKLAMGNCGTEKISEINRAYVATPDWKI